MMVANFLTGIASFVILLGILIFIHELGHFAAAKLSNVYVVRFSLGFGKRLFGIKRGETDYCVSAIPFGGYVKMVGQEDMPRSEEEAADAEPDLPDIPPERRFNTRSTFVKVAISVAGPLLNILFAIPLLWVTFMIGVPIPLSSDSTRIGAVYEDSPAEAAGLEPGQRILSINGDPMSRFEDLQLTIITSAGDPLDLEVEDISGEISHITAVAVRAEGATRPTLGIEPFFLQKVSFVSPGMAADRAGILEGDVILAYADNPPDNESMMKLVETVNASAGIPIAFTILRGGSVENITVVPDEVSVVDGVDFIGSKVAFIDEETAGEEAMKLQPGDVVTAVNGKPVNEEDTDGFLSTAIYEYSDGDVELDVERSGGFLAGTEKFSVTVPLGKTGRMGVSFALTRMRKFPPGEAFMQGLSEFKRYCKLAIVTPYYLIAGRLSIKEVSGPVGIAVMTEMYRRLGFSYYLTIMALISVHLGIINLLPIPMLDGGMIALSLFEGIRRKPVSEKYMIIFQKVGFAFIIMLVVVATYNDLLRAVRFFLGGEFLE
jgi:regulator of sigma E protease